MASSLSLKDSTNPDLSLTDTLGQPNDYKRRLSKPGRKTSKSGYRDSQEVDGIVQMCLTCSCILCVQKLPRAAIVWYGFPEAECAYYIRKRQQELKDLTH